MKNADWDWEGRAEGRMVAPEERGRVNLCVNCEGVPQECEEEDEEKGKERERTGGGGWS